MADPTAAAVVLIPPARQTLWGVPAVLNLVLGGLGAGAWVAAAGLGPLLVVTVVGWLGPALVLAGFAAVGAEAGRPLRGMRVATRLGTSWMSRELALGGAFVLLAGADLLAPAPALRGAAVAAAVAFALAQGFLLRQARAVTAWSVAPMPLVFLASALVSGTGLVLLLEALGGAPPGGALIGATLSLLALALGVWLAYLGWSRDDAFAAATRALRAGPGAVGLVGGGYLAPFVAAALAAAVPDLARPAAAVAGAAMVAGQVYAKSRLVLGAAALRPVTLANVRVHRRSP